MFGEYFSPRKLIYRISKNAENFRSRSWKPNLIPDSQIAEDNVEDGKYGRIENLVIS